MSIVLVGSTSGSITLQEPAVAGTTVLDLPATSGTVLTTGSPQSGGVIQVVNAAITTYLSSSTTTFIDTGVTATITPKFNTSKILVFIDHAGCSKETNNTGMKIRVLRGATQIVYIADIDGYTNTTTNNFFGSIGCNYLDSPATTSATTYKSQFASQFNLAVVSIGNYNSTPVTSTITLMEIAA